MRKSKKILHSRWPLLLQVTLSLSVVLILVSLLTAYLTFHIVSDFEFNRAKEKNISSLSLLSATAIDAVITEDIPLLNTIATQTLKQSPQIHSLIIENEQGKRMVQQSQNDITPDNMLRTYSHSIIFENENFGSIIMQMDIRPIKKQINNQVTRVQIFVISILLTLTALIVILIHWLTIRPIRIIIRYLNSISESQQQLPLRLSISASRELELLASSASELSEMMLQRYQREKELLQTREELIEAHNEALSASRAKSGFLAAMSHEIRTPMNAVLGILGLLRDTALDKHQKQLVRTGRDSGELLLTIINDILDFSKMEADKLQLEQSGFDLHRLLTHSAELLRHQADRKGLALILRLEPVPDLPRYVKGDPDRLRQILINLINNAIKFTPNGTITISASATTLNYDKLTANEETFILSCSVQDTGIGIPEDLQYSLFEEFTMADQSHSRNHEGTGLGLAICKRLVTLMDGNIECCSELGKGSNFVFAIELKTATEEECSDRFSIDEPQLIPDSNTRILLAEDNPANQMVIKNILEYAGLQVDIVANGREAVEAIRSLPYDIILMDISMPEMDGMTATREIRKLPGEKGKLAIVALTAHALSGDRERFIQAGMDDYLSKPIDKKATLHCIASWTNKKINKNPEMTAPINQNEAPASDISKDEQYEYVDEQVLQQLIHDTDAEIVPELLTLYIVDAKKRSQLIKRAFEEKDIRTLEFESHTLGSSAAAHGNEKLHRQSRAIEHLCQEGNHQQALQQTATLLSIADESFRLLTLRVNKGFNNE